MHLLGILILLFLIMADIPCPSCSKTVKGECGLSVHISRWCTANQSDLIDLLQQCRAYTQTVVEEEKRRIHIEKEEQAEREQKEMEEDALRAQCSGNSRVLQ